MNKIWFSHQYHKQPTFLPFQAKLLQVLKTNKSELSKDFIEYDTAIAGGGNYALPEGALILLLFQYTNEESGIFLFPTLRRFYTAKFEYYKSKTGEMFECELVRA